MRLSQRRDKRLCGDQYARLCSARLELFDDLDGALYPYGYIAVSAHNSSTTVRTRAKPENRRYRDVGVAIRFRSLVAVRVLQHRFHRRVRDKYRNGGTCDFHCYDRILHSTAEFRAAFAVLGLAFVLLLSNSYGDRSQRLKRPPLFVRSASQTQKSYPFRLFLSSKKS